MVGPTLSVAVVGVVVAVVVVAVVAVVAAVLAVGPTLQPRIEKELMSMVIYTSALPLAVVC